MNRQFQIAFAAAALVGLSAFRSVAQTSAPAPKDRAHLVLSHDLPKLEGDHLKAVLVEVRYGPGEMSPPHSHSCVVIGYVVEGAIRTQLDGEPETTFNAGESFYEAPNGVHRVSGNASSTEPAKFVAYFVCDHDAPLSTNLPAPHEEGGLQ